MNKKELWEHLYKKYDRRVDDAITELTELKVINRRLKAKITKLEGEYKK